MHCPAHIFSICRIPSVFPMEQTPGKQWLHASAVKPPVSFYCFRETNALLPVRAHLPILQKNCRNSSSRIQNDYISSLAFPVFQPVSKYNLIRFRVSLSPTEFLIFRKCYMVPFDRFAVILLACIRICQDFSRP